MNTAKPLSLVTALFVATAAAPALAYEAGDTIVRAGIAQAAPQDDSSLLSVDGTPLAGTGASVEDETQLGLTISYLVNDYWGVELLASSPFTHVVNADGLGIEVGEVKHLPPTLSAQFFPLGHAGTFKPYIGLGVNYTVFFSEDLSSEFVSALGDGEFELDDSFGLAAEIGADFAITDRLVLNASVWKADIDTTAEIDLDAGAQINVDVDIDPVVYMIGLGYRF